MSHSQFHCTGRAYLDMHGLIFETSICYWQDQPGRGKREHTEPGVAGARGAGRGRRGGGRPPQRGREGRRTPGPDRQPTLGTTRGRGAPPRRRSVEGRGWGGFPFPAPLPPTHTTSAAHNLGAARERGRGPREVARSPGRRAGAELLFLGRGPLHRGVLQQLMHTEFSLPGEQKDWYPAEAMRQAADDAHDLRYRIPATQSRRSAGNQPAPEPDSEKTVPRRAEGRYRPHTVHGLSLDQKDSGPRAAPGIAGFCTPHVPRPPDGRGFGAGLFPLRSPLLRESLLVSFPPLSNMLKFSGLSRLI